MQTFFATFFVFLGIILLMSVGYLVKRKAIHGSCGGLAGIGVEKACDCPEPCDKRKARMAKAEAKAAAEAEREARLAKDRIL